MPNIHMFYKSILYKKFVHMFFKMIYPNFYDPSKEKKLYLIT